jgi:hypothetical protein
LLASSGACAAGFFGLPRAIPPRRLAAVPSCRAAVPARTPTPPAGPGIRPLKAAGRVRREGDIVSTPGMLINLFPALVAAFQASAAMLLLGGASLIVGCLASRWLRVRREETIRAAGAAAGLSGASAAFLGRVFKRDGIETAEFQLRAPELLRQRLAACIAQRRSGDDGAGYAESARALLDELGHRRAAFEGAPRPFDQLMLRDAADPTARSVTAFVTAVDERNLTLISRQPCPWAVRRDLLVSPVAGGEAFGAALLLRPMPPGYEWVLTHDLVDVITNRRNSVRVPCRIETFVLPDTGDPLMLRERLQQDETLDAETLRRTRGWTQRHAVTVLDLSTDGARLQVEHTVTLHERLHLVLTGEDGEVLALPLTEAVSLAHGDDGAVLIGCRFVGVRLKERLRLAGLVRTLAERAHAQP